jgi:hypothetical protein
MHSHGMDDDEYDDYEDYEDYEDDPYDSEDEASRTAFFKYVITVAYRRYLLTHSSQIRFLPVCKWGTYAF